ELRGRSFPIGDRVPAGYDSFRHSVVFFRLAAAQATLYPGTWDTPPQRGALIWKDSSNGD
ncbi:hypothetical protein N9H60_04005, partial [Flavimaricola sp.]